jgi:Mg2+-importing ATPase
VEAGVILLIVGINAILGFVQEYRADHAVRALRRLMTPMARVIRDGSTQVIPAAQLVRGDLVSLEVGDLVPADVQLITADELSADEAALTGESTPVPKSAGEGVSLGSAVASGYGRGVVIATGRATALGRTAHLLEVKPAATDFERGLRRFSDFLVLIVLGLTAFVFLANAAQGKGWLDSFLFALALAVGITPEVLPIIVTLTLARGALRMARDQVVVKRLGSVEDLGNIDILCCDKTGTLTAGEFTLRDYRSVDGRQDPRILIHGALAGSTAMGVPVAPAANPTDRATWNSDALASRREELARYQVLDRNAFDFRRRRASALVTGEGRRFLVVKGAADAVLSACGRMGSGGCPTPLTPECRARLEAQVVAYEEDGYRVLAVADRDFDGDVTTAADEVALDLRGFLLYLDPPKAEVRDALAQLSRLGVGLKILTGDSAVVARRICREVGLPVGPLATGVEVANAGPDSLRQMAQDYHVFARVDPEQKQQLVTALRRTGHVVGFLGDGVNDAPALRASDIGLAVTSGTDVAKEAADIILLEKSLGVLAGGIVEGRKTFANITKYILNTVSANFGNMATVAASSLFLRFIPLLPSQILLNNLLSDLPLLTIAADRVDPDLLQRPRRWHIGVIARFMVTFGLLSALFDLLLIGALLRLPSVDPGLFRTAWFVESALSEIAVTFAVRTRLALLRSRPSPWLLWASVAAWAGVIAIIYTSLGRVYFDFTPLPGEIAALVLSVLLGYLGAAELVKRPFFRRFEI